MPPPVSPKQTACVWNSDSPPHAMPSELPPPACPSAGLPGEVPLLQSFMLALERETGMCMSFDDFTGYMQGFHEDVKPMRLDWQHQLHSCEFCQLAKQDSRGELDCVLNKLAANRIVLHRRAGLEGECRLGLFDIAEPLIHGGRVLGVFYYGSVLVRGREEASRSKIRSYCQRRNLNAESFLKALESVTVIEEESIPRHREALCTVVRLAGYLCETYGVQQEMYRSRELKYPYIDPKTLPYTVKASLQYIIAHLGEPFIVKDIAAHLSCHPDYLSRSFKQHTGIDLSTYVKQARVDHAKRLLENPKLDIWTTSEMCGFSDRVHFSKVFRRITGMTPGQYQRQVAVK